MSKLPTWVDYNPFDKEWVAMLQVLVRDGREQSVPRFARRYNLRASRVKTRFDSMVRNGLLERREGWDGVMFKPTEYGRKVADRGY